MARISSTLTVTASDRVSPTIQRLSFRVSDITPFAQSPHTDAYVKLIFGPAAGNKAAGDKPTMRTYTVHSIDAEAGTLAIDFVLHGEGADSGIAAAWAASARPGDEIEVRGPGGAYSPDPAASHHLICGDATAIPAIASAIKALPAGAIADVVVEAPDSADVDLIPNHASATITHIAPADAPDAAPGDALVEMTAAVVGKLRDQPDFDPERIQVFVHGEAGAVMKRIRPLLKDAGIQVRGASISGYWRVGRTEEAFRVWKQENRPEDA